MPCFARGPSTFTMLSRLRTNAIRVLGAILLLSALSKCLAFLAFVKAIPVFFSEPLWITALLGIVVIAAESTIGFLAIARGNTRPMIWLFRCAVVFFLGYNLLVETGLLGFVFKHKGGCGCTPSLYSDFFVSPTFLVLKLALLAALAAVATDRTKASGALAGRLALS